MLLTRTKVGTVLRCSIYCQGRSDVGNETKEESRANQRFGSQQMVGRLPSTNPSRLGRAGEGCVCVKDQQVPIR